MCRIVSIEGQNVKRIKAVKLVPDGAGTFIVGGQPDQGKSSALDMIMYAMGGGKMLPPKPLRKGAKNGKIKIDLGETSHGHLIVERTFTESGSELVIKSKDGYEAPSPQSILNDLCGQLTFDPLAFSRLKAKDQLDTLRELVGIDTSALDKERDSVFTTRTSVNRDVKQLEGELKGLPHYEDAPDEVVSVAELAKQLDDASHENNLNDRARRSAAEIAKHAEDAKLEADDTRRHIERLQAELKEQEAHVIALQEDHKLAVTATAALVDKDLAPIREQIATAETTNAKVRANDKRAEVEQRLVTAKNRSAALTERIDAIDTEKHTAITSAKFPIAGLGFSDDYVTFDGLPFEQACTNTKIRVSAAMGIAMNPEFKVWLIREGSLLGNESLAMLDEMAKQADAQIWIERVSEGDECSVIIEDGAVKEDRTVQAETVSA